MKYDIQLPVTNTQFEALKKYDDLDQGINEVLSSGKIKRITVFLRDPAYELHLVRPFRGNAAYLRMRLGKPRTFIPMPHKLRLKLEEASRQLGITVNQFIQAAIRSRVDSCDDGAAHLEATTTGYYRCETESVHKTRQNGPGRSGRQLTHSRRAKAPLQRNARA